MLFMLNVLLNHLSTFSTLQRNQSGNLNDSTPTIMQHIHLQSVVWLYWDLVHCGVRWPPHPPKKTKKMFYQSAFRLYLKSIISLCAKKSYSIVFLTLRVKGDQMLPPHLNHEKTSVHRNSKMLWTKYCVGSIGINI